MSSSAPYPQFINAFNQGIDIVKQQQDDEFHNRLYFSNIISLMEQYLSNLFMHEITSNRDSLKKLANHKKLKALTVSIPFALNNSIEEYIFKAIKALVWHRLNDIEIYYKAVLDIKFNINGNLIGQLKIRHDIVHRNGFNMDGKKLKIRQSDLEHCIELVEQFVSDIDRKYHAIRCQTLIQPDS